MGDPQYSAFLAAIETVVAASGVPLRAMVATWDAITTGYRTQRGTAPLHPGIAEKKSSENYGYRKHSGNASTYQTWSEDYRRCLTYLVARAPATFAAAHAVMQEMMRLGVPWPQTVHDIGGGPGTWGWAMAKAQKSNAPPWRYTCWDIASPWAQIGPQLLSCAGSALPKQNWHWKVGDFTQDQANADDSADWIVLAYALGEVPFSALDKIFDAVWPRVKSHLILIEPGTPEGFSRLLLLRARALAAGGVIVAPCTGVVGAAACPMAPEVSLGFGAAESAVEAPVDHLKDWCHFATRFARPAGQRYLKKATRGFEDEPFSYLVVARSPSYPIESAARVIKPIQRRQGHVNADICGGCQHTIRRVSCGRAHPAYRVMRALKWGDVWGEHTIAKATE